MNVMWPPNVPCSVRSCWCRQWSVVPLLLKRLLFVVRYTRRPRWRWRTSGSGCVMTPVAAPTTCTESTGTWPPLEPSHSAVSGSNLNIYHCSNPSSNCVGLPPVVALVRYSWMVWLVLKLFVNGIVAMWRDAISRSFQMPCLYIYTRSPFL